MKRIFVATLALATLFACNKDIANENSSIEDKVWVEFTAGIDTKASLVEGDKVTPHTITWEVDDLIAVNGETLKASEAGSKTTFTGEVGPAFLDATSYKAIYPRAAGTSFDAVTVEHEQDAVANGFDDIVAVAYSTTRSLNFKHVTSLIRFQVPSDFANITEVSFTADEALAGVVNVTHDSADGNPAVEVTTAENTVTLKGTFKDETDYYVAVLPGAKTNLVVRINGYLSKTYPTATIPTSGVGNMGELPAPVANTNYGIAGSMQSPTPWNASNPVSMYEESTNTIVAKNIELYKDDEFKVVVDKKWDESYPNNNFSVDKNGLFDITFNTKTKTITATCVKEYTDLTVKIKVQKNSWETVNVHLWKELGDADEGITSWPGNTMIEDTHGMYYCEVDGDLIGSELGIIFNNGVVQTCDLFAKLSHNGLIYTLTDGTKCRLEITSSKGWDVYNIYSWVGDTKLSGVWPGTEMEKASDNVYYYEFEADKDNWDINYVINNGSSQTDDLSIKLHKWVVAKNNI